MPGAEVTTQNKVLAPDFAASGETKSKHIETVGYDSTIGTSTKENHLY